MAKSTEELAAEYLSDDQKKGAKLARMSMKLLKLTSALPQGIVTPLTENHQPFYRLQVNRLKQAAT